MFRRAIGGAMSEDEPLEERIGGESIGAVQARAGSLADGEEPGQRGLAVEVGAHAAADVVRRGHHRDGLLRHVDPEGEARLVDVREVLDEEPLPEVPHVEEGAVVAAPLELAVDAAGHHVARRQLAARVVALHERFAGPVAEDPALAAQRLADEEAFRVRMVEAGRVELDEFEICDGRARPVRHGEAVSGRDVGIRRVQVDLPRAARGEDHHAGGEGFHLPRARVERVAADDAIRTAQTEPAAGDEVDGHVLVEDADLRCVRGGEQRALHFAAGQVGGVEDTAGRMPTFAGQVVAERRRVPRELRAEVDQLADPGWPL